MKNIRFFLLLMAPAILLTGILLYFPLFYSAFLSLFKWSIAHSYEKPIFIGLRNYASAFGDSEFIRSIINTVLYTVLGVVFSLVIGVFLAVLLNTGLPGVRIFSVLLFIPGVISPVAVGIIWKVMLNTDMGVVCWLAIKAGLPITSFLSDPTLAFISLVSIGVWQSVPFVFTLSLAALQQLPVEPIEAAKIDGATALQTFFRIVLPTIKPVLVVVTTMRIMDAFRVFDTIFILTGGGPAGATQSVSIYAMLAAFDYFETSYASALSFSIFLMIFWFSVLNLAINKPFKEG